MTDEREWHHLPADAALGAFATAAVGLSDTEASRRLRERGPNELTTAGRVKAWRILVAQFKGLLVWLLIGAAVLSGIIGDRIDALAIFAIVILNAAVGFYQEIKAEKSISALKTLTAPQAKVRRDGRVTLIPASAVVAGDILSIEAGDLVAADARILCSAALTCIESALTGESETVDKMSGVLRAGHVPLAERANTVFMGTSVASGTGEAVVIATGMRTELGQIATLLDAAETPVATPLQRQLDSIGRILVVAALAIVALLFGLGSLRGTAPFELLMTAISLAVAAVPEGLPAVVTVALSLGVHRMARRRALVRRLAAVETLGATTVICTDKTGTLTAGEMTVRALYTAGQTYDVTGQGYAPDGEVHVYGQHIDATSSAALTTLGTMLAGCNNATVELRDDVWQSVGDPTESALLVAGIKMGVVRAELEKEMPKLHELPFDSDRKRSAVIRRVSEGNLRAIINGAPGPLLERCSQLFTDSGVRSMTAQDRLAIQASISSMAEQSLRVLGSAYHDLGQRALDTLTEANVELDMVFVGLSGMHDPPRPEARQAIAKCREAGIRVVMITGDHPQTATAIATGLAIDSGDRAVTGVELDAMSDADLLARATGVGVYARVTAAHKLRIIRALQAHGDVVAMTGDGVNDAPAIKGADIGIAMGRSGTEVTKQAADIIITDDNFATIVAAVDEGRGIYQNIRKTLGYLLAGNAGELLLMLTCVAVGLPFPLLPIHLLWINLVTDGIPALCLATDPIDPDVMTRPPRRRTDGIADGQFFRSTLVTGFLTAGVALGVFVYVMRNDSVMRARTCAFAVLVFAELFRSFGARSDRTLVWRIPLLTNRRLVAVVAASIAIQLWSQHNAVLGRLLKSTAVSFADGAILLALGLLPSLALELLKLVPSRPRRRAA